MAVSLAGRYSFPNNSGINFDDPGFSVSGANLGGAPNELTGDYKQMYLFNQLMKGGRETTAEQMSALLPFMKELDERRAKTATEVARQKLGDEAALAGIGALAKGVQTAIAGGSPEALALMSRAPMTRFREYQDALGAYARPNLPAFAPSNYVSPRYFG